MTNPTDRWCWHTCSSCYRCADKGTRAQCASCSGHHDPLDKWAVDADDVCDCRNGILRMRTQNGRLIVAKYPHNPYGGTVRADEVTADERDWEAFLAEQREKYNEEDWDPVVFADGSSSDAWLHQHRRGGS